MNESDSAPSSPMLQGALRLAEQGFRVFPCEPGGKRPHFGVLGGQWPMHASAEPLDIALWWSQYPNANVLVVCGVWFLVLDFDVKGNKPGEALAVELLGHDWKQRYSYVATPSGGYHVYVRLDERTAAWGNRKGVAGALDIQGEGSYVVAPPSRTGEGPYLLVNPQLPLVTTADEGLVARVLARCETPVNRRVVVDDVVPDWTTASVPRGTTERLPQKVQDAMLRGDWSEWDDDRSRGAMGVAAALWGQQLDDAQVMAVLMGCPETLQVAWDRRPSYEGAAEWMWKYVALPARPPDPAEIFGLRGGPTPPACPEPTGSPAPEPSGPSLSLLDAALVAVERLTTPTVFAEVDSLLGTLSEQDFLPHQLDHVLDALAAKAGLKVQGLRSTMAKLRRGVAEERRVAAKAKKQGPIAEYVYVEQTGAFWCLPEPGWVNRTAFKDMYGLTDDDLRDVLAKMSRVRRATYQPHNPWSADYDESTARWNFNAGTVRTELNTWQPPAFHPTMGATEDDAGPWLRMARNVLRVPEAELAHIVRWMAFTLQHPSVKVNHMVLLGGDQGIGKDHFIAPMVEASRGNVLQVPGLSADSSFDHAGLASSHLLVLQELRLGGRFRDAAEAYDAMKNRLAAPPMTIPINIKFVKQYDIPNVINVLAMTNHPDAIRLERDDRRAFMVWCQGRKGEVPGGDAERYWTGFHNWMYHDGGAEVVAGYLLGLDVSDFNPGMHPPDTEWKETTSEESLPPVTEAMMEMLSEPEWATRELATVVELRDAVQMRLIGHVAEVTRYQVRDAMGLLRYRSRRVNDPGSNSKRKTTVYLLRNDREWADADAEELKEWLRVERAWLS